MTTDLHPEWDSNTGFLYTRGDAELEIDDGVI